MTASAQTTVTLQPDSATGKDAVLHGLSSEVNNNYGSNAQLSASAWTFNGTPGVVRSLIEFDLSSIPNGAVINSAYLSFYSWDSNGGFGQHSTLSGSNAFWLQRVTSSWDELTVTWNTQPTVDTINQVSLPASDSSTQDYLDINVTTLIQNMVSATNYGLMLKLQDETYHRRINFASSDHTNAILHPKLVITYSLISSEINEIKTINVITTYPNPTAGVFTIKKTSGITSSFEITDILGKVIQTGVLTGNETTIDLSKNKSGAYLLKTNGQTIKLLKQ